MQGTYESGNSKQYRPTNEELLAEYASIAAVLGGTAVVLTMSSRREPSKKGTICPRPPKFITIDEITPVIDPMKFTGEDPQVLFEVLTEDGEELDVLPEAIVTNPKQWLDDITSELVSVETKELSDERAEDKVTKLKYLAAIARKIRKEQQGEDEMLDTIFARIDHLRRQLFEG